MTLEASLLHEVSRVQHDKTLLAVRDCIDQIRTTEYDAKSYQHKPIPAEEFKAALLNLLRQLAEGEK